MLIKKKAALGFEYFFCVRFWNLQHCATKLALSCMDISIRYLDWKMETWQTSLR